MTQQFSYADVVHMVRNLVARKGTGTLYVKTDHNRVVIIGVRAGEIVTFASGPKRGEQAIPILRDMSSAAVRVEDSALTYHRGEMPPTAVLIAMLVSTTSAQASESPANEPTGTDSPMGAETVKAVVCHLLGPHLGPITPLICEEVVGDITGPLDAEERRKIIERLAAEITDPTEALQFVSEAHKQLRL